MQGDNTKLPESTPVPENASSQEQAASSQPELVVTNTEAVPASTVAPVQDDATQSAPAVTQADATTADPTTATAAAPTIDPTVQALEASDADIIEKEWVDQADKIMAARANDPAGEEEAEEDLSQAYLKKRFNVDVEDAK